MEVVLIFLIENFPGYAEVSSSSGRGRKTVAPVVTRTEICIAVLSMADDSE
jgi:hypothetical protein